MDINAGRILSEGASVEEVGAGESSTRGAGSAGGEVDEIRRLGHTEFILT